MSMRSLFSLLAAATVLASPCTHAAASAADALGPQHQLLAGLAGQWTVRQSFWTDPAKPPAIDRGTARFTPILAGQHLRQELHIDAAGKPFDGLGYLGYDQAAGDYGSLWMDVNFKGVILAHGGYDAATHAFTFVGQAPDAKGALSPLREVLHIQDADHFTYEYYERHDGKEGLAVRLEYARAK
ncbi:DUF1579 family protein [Dokdonella sp.]|uniref:DUF1579 family protein n=1 Tax=Dokdonella sp. TaxID=2291710 RepID=UPI001B07DC47|nr:DUF1579 family protein [Dokdonella sp.]MBO9664033.1 DUF1579 family protein [Dokdonella sp.]